jgi:hypothetical protein
MGTMSIKQIKVSVAAAVLGLCMIGIMNEVRAQETSIYRLQSLFIYNFTKHIKWENVEGQTFTVGIYGNTEALKEINANLSSKMVWGKNIKVVAINSAAEASRCHIVYLPKSNRKKVTDFMGTLPTTNTLIVTEEDLTTEGAAISFVLNETKVGFKVNKDRLEGAGLKVSTSLMSLSTSV